MSANDKQKRVPPPLHMGDTNQNPPGIGILRLLLEDLRTHERNPFEQGFWAVAVHRFGNWRMGIRFRPLRVPFTLLYRFLFKLTECLCGISIPYATKLGRRVRIWHFGGMVLHARSIGNDVHLKQNTAIGNARKDVLLHDILPYSVAVGLSAKVVKTSKPANQEALASDGQPPEAMKTPSRAGKVSGEIP